MANIFIRTSIAPYRIDTYNALHERMGMQMYFYNRVGRDQAFDVGLMESLCVFRPMYLNGITLKSQNRKWCFGLWKMLRRENPAVVIVPEFQLSAVQVLLYKWLSRATFKVVSMTDDSYDMIVNANDFTKLHGWLRKHMARYFDDFIVVTPEVEGWYRENFGKGIWLPIIMDEKKAVANYERLLPLSRDYAQQYGLRGKRILLSVSRLVALKNIHRVIDAFAKSDTDATLVIVGDGPERAALEEHAATVEKEIIFTGRFDGDALYAWYNLASVFILASYQEPFGAVTNEALLSGCRVIVSERAGSACLVSDENGELIDPMDVSGMAMAIDRQLSATTPPDLHRVRQSRMVVSFHERMDNLVMKIMG